MCVEFQLSSSSIFRDMRGPKFTPVGSVPRTPPSGKIFIPEYSTWPVWMCIKFQLSISHSSRDIKGVPNFAMACQIFTQTSPSFCGQSSRAFGALQRRVPHSALRRRLLMWIFVGKLFAIWCQTRSQKCPFSGVLGDFSLGVEIY